MQRKKRKDGTLDKYKNGSSMRDRLNRFIGHYRKLREKRSESNSKTFLEVLLSQVPLGAYHPSYSIWNCAIWAWSNSGTHKVNGEYL